jgi:Flp pilus assembly protein TadD
LTEGLANKLIRVTAVSTPILLLLSSLLSSCSQRHMTSLKQTGAATAYAQNIDKQIVNAVNAGDGDYELRVLRARLDANPLDLTARLELAGSYQKLGFTEVAIEHGRLACERAPDSDDAHIALAKMLRDAARSPEAAGVLSAYTSSHAGAGAAVWAWLGLLQDDTGDWKTGEAAHRRALALDPQRDDFHNNLGYCLLRQGRKEEAAGEFRAALKLHPRSVIAENNLGMALAAGLVTQNRFAQNKEAVAHLQSVTDPATAHNNMAVAMIEEGRYADARQEIDLALRYNRAHPAALNNLRLVADLEGRPAEMQRVDHGPGKWSRVTLAWHRFWSGAAPDGQDKIASGSTVASR